MTKRLSGITLTSRSMVFTLDNISHGFKSDHPLFPDLRDYLMLSQGADAFADDIKRLITSKAVIIESISEKVSVVHGQVLFEGRAVHSSLTEKMLADHAKGYDIKRFALFMENVMRNPSKDSRDDLYDFLTLNDMPITADGHFLAYKRVSSGYTDTWTGTINNRVGEHVTMPREKVCDDRHAACAPGLHACGWGYFGGGVGSSGHLMAVKINPKDVVSVPIEHHRAKLRCCDYWVVGEITWRNDALTGEDADKLLQQFKETSGHGH